MCYHHHQHHSYDSLHQQQHHHYHHRLNIPCLHCDPHAYIRMVQYLIEKCLLMRLNIDQCTSTLAHHANIKPLVTLTVWRELVKENRDFFHAYHPLATPSPPTTRVPSPSTQITVDAPPQRHCSPTRFSKRRIRRQY